MQSWRFLASLDARSRLSQSINNCYISSFDLPSKNHFLPRRLLLRIVASEFGSRQAMNRKYGCYIDDAKELLQLACDMNLTVVGVAYVCTLKIDAFSFILFFAFI